MDHPNPDVAFRANRWLAEAGGHTPLRRVEVNETVLKVDLPRMEPEDSLRSRRRPQRPEHECLDVGDRVRVNALQVRHV